MGKTEEAVLSQPVTRHSLAEAAQDLGCHILLAEDNEINQEVALAMLNSLGCQVEVVSNGLQAVEAMSRTRYDLILMDCQMPGMDGYKATQAIRQREESETKTQRQPLRAIPIIALTAHAMEGDQERCLAAGMNDYLAKPFKINQLCDVLKRWLPKSTVEAPSDLSPIDQKALDNIRALQRKGTPDLLSNIIHMYLKNSRRLLQTLQDAVNTGDAPVMQKTAHDLKSNSATVGATALAKLCKDMEARGRTKETENAQDLLSKLEAAHEKACVALAKEIPEEGQ